jgi:shikimate kinase
MILKLVRTPGIYLVGFMGSGKTTVGRILADRMGWNFVDLDAEIEAEQKTVIAAIFDQCGEEHFRQIETQAIRQRVHQVRAGCPTVIALGGGAFLREENFDLLEDHGVTVWLDCPLEMARGRLEGTTHRPLARDFEAFAVLYEARRAGYARADYRIEIRSNDPLEAVAAIEALPIF